MDKQKKEIVKNIKKDIKQRKLSNEEKIEYYNSIYQIYGSEVFNLVTPPKIQKRDIKNMLKLGNFEDIYFKYGEDKYNKNIYFMKEKDIEFSTGNKFLSSIYKVNSFIKRNIVAPLLGLSLALPSSASTLSFIEKSKERNENLNEIEDYIDSIENYANSVNQYDLSDLEIMMKVTKDMWDSIDGYGIPKKDLTYYPGLDLYSADKVGVCRNMADDVARKLNAINKNYNARVLFVYASGSGYTYANINTKYAVQENSQENENEDSSDVDYTQYTGNHAIVIVDIKDDNVTLTLDPTNPGIGVFKDGKIILFNTPEQSNFGEKVTPFLNYITSTDSLGLSAHLLSSFREPDLSIEELEKKYGLEAQNDALLSLENKEKSFKDSIVVKLDNNTKAVASLNRDKQVLNLGDTENER